MKTTLDIDDRLLREAKVAAARERKSLTRLIEEGLSLRLRAKLGKAAGAPPPLPVSKQTGGMMPGIDPCSNKSMLDAMDDYE